MRLAQDNCSYSKSCGGWNEWSQELEECQLALIVVGTKSNPSLLMNVCVCVCVLRSTMKWCPILGVFLPYAGFPGICLDICFSRFLFCNLQLNIIPVTLLENICTPTHSCDFWSANHLTEAQIHEVMQTQVKTSVNFTVHRMGVWFLFFFCTFQWMDYNSRRPDQVPQTSAKNKNLRLQSVQIMQCFSKLQLTSFSDNVPNVASDLGSI